jgi:hypothetical protein
LNLVEGFKQVVREPIVANRPVVVLDIGVLLGLSRLDEIDTDPAFRSPELAQRLVPLLAAGALPDLERLRHELAPRPGLYPSVTVSLPALASYDRLLEAA